MSGGRGPHLDNSECDWKLDPWTVTVEDRDGGSRQRGGGNGSLEGQQMEQSSETGGFKLRFCYFLIETLDSCPFGKMETLVSTSQSCCED